MENETQTVQICNELNESTAASDPISTKLLELLMPFADYKKQRIKYHNAQVQSLQDILNIFTRDEWGAFMSVEQRDNLHEIRDKVKTFIQDINRDLEILQKPLSTA